VQHGVEGFVVNLDQRTLTCKEWELSGLPCVHAITIIREERVKLEDYAHDFYYANKYKKEYAFTI